MSNFSSTYPSVSPVFQANFAANGGRIDPRATFSRASTGSYFGTEKVLSSENLLLQSENFTTTWTIQDASGAAGATAPDGGTDGYTVTAHSGSSKGPRASQSLSGKLSTSTQYTMVGHVKAGTATHGYISFRGTNSNNYAYAQIQFSSPGSVSTGGAGFTSISGTVTALGSSWYKLTLTATTGSDVSGAFAFLGVNDGTAFGISGYPAWTSAGETLEVWGAQLSTTQAKVYDSPTTTQIARNHQTKLQTAASGAARFEHSATDGQSGAKGLLVESASTNLFTYSSDASNAAWTKTGTTATAEAIGPDGQLSAFAVRETTATSVHILRQAVTIGSGSVAFSIYAKLLGNSRRMVLREDSTTGAYATFDLSTGTVVASGAGGTGSIEAVGNGFYRCTMVSSPGADTKNFSAWVVQSTATTYETYTGDGYSGLLLAMPQIEDQSFASSWISTTSSTATRAADSLSVTTADIGYTGGPVTLFAETEGGQGNYPTSFNLNDGTSSNQLSVYRGSANATTATNRVVYVKSDGSVQVESTMTSSSAAGKIAVSLDTNDAAATSSGNAVTTDTSVTLPSGLSQLIIGATWNGTTKHLNGTIKRVALYNEALSDTNLQALTS